MNRRTTMSALQVTARDRSKTTISAKPSGSLPRLSAGNRRSDGFELLGDGQGAGWTKEEVLAAMIEVAENTNLASKRVAFGRDRVEAIVKEMNV